MTFGFHDWWYTNFAKRPMILKAYVGEETIDWGTCGTASDPNTIAVTRELSLDGNKDVTLSIERGSADAPVLSWITVESTSDTDRAALKEQLNQAGLLKSEDYSKESFAALTTAVSAGMAQLLPAKSTQAGVDQAATAIQDAMNKLDVSEVSRASLQAAIDDAKKLDITKYTIETAEALSAALTAAEDLLKKTSIVRTELETTKSNLD